jgi:hypothetical protein
LITYLYRELLFGGKTMGDKIRKVLIFGGGNSGWMTGAYLSQFLNIKNNPDIELTLIESPSIPAVGIGESSVPHIRSFLKALGFSEAEWLSACKGSVKLGTTFVNWSGKDKNDIWRNPFDSHSPEVKGFSLADWWTYLHIKQGQESFPNNFSLSDFLMEKKKAPRLLEDKRNFTSDVEYAYHFDAKLHGNYCKRFAIANGLKHIVDTVKGVSVNLNGEIDYLHTEKNGEVHADLFIDCSGFKGELISRALNEPFIPYSDFLLCDRAVSIHVPHKGQNLNPYTTSTALNSGWVWDIPLSDNTSYGYVYSNSFTSREKAEEELRQFIGKRASEIEAQHITLRAGRSRSLWVKNCVAIGLAGGFSDPLESTGLYLTQRGIEELVNYWPNTRSESFFMAEYNRIMRAEHDTIKNFIALHYCTSSREDTAFWESNKNSLILPQEVKELLAIWKSGVLMKKTMHIPGKARLDAPFAVSNHQRLFTGMHYLPNKAPGTLGFHENTEVLKTIKSIQQKMSEEAERYPSHNEFVDSLNKRKVYGSTISKLSRN